MRAHSSFRLSRFLVFLFAVCVSARLTHAADPLAADPFVNLHAGHPRLLFTDAQLTAAAAKSTASPATALTTEFTPTAAPTRLALFLTPVGDHWPRHLPAPPLTPLTLW